MASLVAYGPDLDEAVAGAPRVSDDRTLLDFEVPKLRTEAALGGGIAYYNSPLRSTFTQLWRERGVLPEGADPPPFYADRHHERVDRSLRRFADANRTSTSRAPDRCRWSVAGSWHGFSGAERESGEPPATPSRLGSRPAAGRSRSLRWPGTPRGACFP